MLFWAGNAIIGRAVRADIPPFTLAFGRWMIAAAILAPFSLKAVLADWPEVRRSWRKILFLGLVGVAAFNGFLYSGLQYTTASNGLLLQALIPALVLLTGAVAFRDRASTAQILGVVLSTIGVVIIVFRGDPNEILALNLGMGDILVLCGCVAWAIYTSFLRIRGTIRPIVFVFLTFCVGVLVMAPFSLHELRGTSLVWTPQVVGAFAYVGIFPSVCAYFLYNDAVARIGPGPAGQTISLMPIFGALLATQLLAEKLHLYHGVGIAAILTGIVGTWTLRPRTNGDAF
jgi:drug/metabolite transporter (DMT)-like permease